MQEKLLNNLKSLEANLKGYKNISKIRQFLEKLLEKFDIEFVILFGSLAKGNWNHRSDIDLLIVSDSIKGNFFQRLYEIQKISPGGIDFFIYKLNEFDKLFQEFCLIALESLGTGILIYDKGIGKNYMDKIRKLINSGKILKIKQGWKILSDMNHTYGVNNS
ncbi:MAG: nucleotidyltransferase domain-containing protein [Candidatus Helarchaeota archaeon]